jgi:hypothetical protein
MVLEGQPLCCLAFSDETELVPPIPRFAIGQ